MKKLMKIITAVKIYRDKRGWVINPLEEAALPHNDVGNLHVVSLNPDTIRGNHFHPDTREWLLVFDGPTLVSGRSNGENSINSFLVEEDKPTLFEIPPGVEHAIKNISDKVIYLLSFSESGERETVHCQNLFDLDK